jgi:hypothetical protein
MRLFPSSRVIRSACFAVLAVAGLVAPAAAETIEITAAECAGMSGFRAHWDRTIPVAEE